MRAPRIIIDFCSIFSGPPMVKCCQFCLGFRALRCSDDVWVSEDAIQFYAFLLLAK